MSGRVLNFSEFFGKYSSDTEKGLDDIKGATSNFEDGFDDDTYEQNPIGPNRPVSGGEELTPAQPGEAGAPTFSSTPDEGMNAPEEEEAAETPEVENTEETEESPEKEEEKEETEEVPEPEAGANPKEDKKVEEAFNFKRVKGFKSYLLESDHGAEYLYDEDWSDDSWKEDHEESGDDFISHVDHECENCGAPNDEYGATCGCNM